MANFNKVKTVKLYKDQDYCIVNEGSKEEQKLRELGYGEKGASVIQPGTSPDPNIIEETSLDEGGQDENDSENIEQGEEISEDEDSLNKEERE